MSLPYIGQQMTIYTGYFTLVTGLVGNGLNVLAFRSRRTYRRTPCTFYFLSASITNLLYLSIILTTRILGVGYGIDPTRTSIIWCKLRIFFTYSLSLITLTCSSLASIDQYLSTSQSVILRRYSNIKLAHRMVFTFVIIWCIHAIPAVVFRDISSVSKSCVNTNGGYSLYTTIYYITFFCAIPVSIMIIFGYLTYVNIHRRIVLVRQGADIQMVRMTLFEVVWNVICLFPYGINSGYAAITTATPKGIDRLLLENFVGTVVLSISYFYYATSCYAFLISSNRFRRVVKDEIFRKWRRNQVNPF